MRRKSQVLPRQFKLPRNPLARQPDQFQKCDSARQPAESRIIDGRIARYDISHRRHAGARDFHGPRANRAPGCFVRRTSPAVVDHGLQPGGERRRWRERRGDIAQFEVRVGIDESRDDRGVPKLNRCSSRAGVHSRDSSGDDLHCSVFERRSVDGKDPAGAHRLCAAIVRCSCRTASVHRFRWPLTLRVVAAITT
jgi:hypothetical protein